MTAVGKILVFFNLMFSVAVAAMIVIVFLTRANWKKEYETVRNMALIGKAKYKERTAELDSLKASSADEIKSKDATIEGKDKTISELREELAKERDERRADTSKLGKEMTSGMASKSEIDLVRKERELLNDDNKKLKEQVIAEKLRTNDQMRIAVENKIEADSQRARAERMLRRNEELERENLSLESRNKLLAAEGGGKPSSLLNPPPLPAPKDVKGTVIAVSPSGIAVISLGSDSGINVGNKLEVSRLDLVNPDRSVYLGEIQISRVEPKQSVGQFIPQPFARASERLPRVKDTVSTGVSGPGR